MKTKFLFPNRFKRIGWIIFISSSFLGIFLLFNLNNLESIFKSLNSKVFTIYSMDLYGSVMFGFIDYNYIPTLVEILIFISAIMVAFSKEKREDEFIAKIRLESLVWATYINYAVLIFCSLFFFGMAFAYIMILNMFTILFFFILRFNFLLYRMNKSLNHEK